MNDRYLYKAKRLDNGEWVEGHYYKQNETTYCIGMETPIPVHHYILFEKAGDWGLPTHMYQVEVNPETICQYTGLTDKNGNKIWENDIVKFEDCSAYPIFYDWNYGCLGSCWYSDFDPMYKYRNTKMEVLGNKFDNPELLSESEE